MLDRIDIKYFKLAVGLERLGKETELDIAARCPVCGDSRSNPRAKRLHLYKSGDYTGVNCFNSGCAAENKTVYSFLRDFFPALLSGYKREKFQDNLSTMFNENESETKDVFDFSDNSKGPGESLLLQEDWTNTEIAELDSELESGIESDSEFDWLTQESQEIAPLSTNDIDLSLPALPEVQCIDLLQFISDIQLHPEALAYIHSRGLEYNPDKFGLWYYGNQDLQIENTLYRVKNNIIIPLYSGPSGGIYGFYARNIQDKFFCTFMQDINHGYKIWNWFMIDKTKPVYIFEGIFDALASGLDNIIALMGAKIPQERLDELQNPIFVLDNDATGLRNSLSYADAGYSVYVQPHRYKEKDMNDLMLRYNNLNIPELIKDNIYKGIMARVKISSLL